MAEWLKRREITDTPMSVVNHVDGCPLSSKHPAIFEHLTCLAWEEGVHRETSSLTVFLQDGRLKACLADKDADLVAFVAASSLTALLESLERGLQDGDLDWRRAREKGGGKPRKSP